MKLLTTILALLLFVSCDPCITHNPTICDSTAIHDSVVLRDSVVIVINDSTIKDSLRVLEIGDGNIIITGNKEHTTFYIDLDSIKVVIRNDSIISIWQRPARSE